MAAYIAWRGASQSDFVSQAELLRAAVELLDEAGIPYMLVGSYASTFHGEPRMTRDIDVVVDPNPESIRLLVDLVDRDRFYMGDAEDAFLNRSMFNLIEPKTGWKVDFVVRTDRPFSKAEFQRRFRAQVAGVEIFMATAEDTMLAKLEWGKSSGSDRQMDDVIAIAGAQQVDVEYLSRWAHELGVTPELDLALASAGKSGRGLAARKPWKAPIEQVVLYQDGIGWQYALAYSSDVADGRLQAHCETLEEAQSEVLAIVEEMTELRYSAKWRSDQPGWWSATLTLL